jgi:hypothetical protein
MVEFLSTPREGRPASPSQPLQRLHCHKRQDKLLFKSCQPVNFEYLNFRKQSGFVTFGAANILDLVTSVGNAALRAVWYQKWSVHRRLRPEAFGGRVHIES